MRTLNLLAGLTLGLGLATAAHAAPVLMISIDGLRPADVIEAEARGFTAPNLRKLMAAGTYSTGVRNSLPTVTYPNHTTLITGVWPAKHGIANNTVFDPEQKNLGGWYWYAEDIKVPTLWDAVHTSGGKVASIGWPVSVNAPSIDYDFPEYWRARIPEDLKLIRALNTPGLTAPIEKASGKTLADIFGETPAADDAKADFAAAIYRMKRPRFFTIHLASLDHYEHEFGPGSAEAKSTLASVDGSVGKLVAAARRTEPDLVVVIVSDHGFAPVEHNVNLIGSFAEAGLVTLDPKTRKVTAWQAMPWGGASAAVVLASPSDEAVKAKTKALLDKLAADPENGINRVIDADGIAKMGGTKQASFWVDFKIGYAMGGSGSPLSPSGQKGTHGYFPEHPEMRASFLIAGPGIPKKGSIGEIDQRDIAPTLAKILKVKLPSADGKPLF
jgi:predicted AlkP superfamily pyrophosphatase or phosphodiesterase